MNKYQRAIQIWALLVCAARERKTYGYGHIAAILGYDGSGTLGQLLAPIMFYCQRKGIPPLTVLVVNQDTELPGEGFDTKKLDINVLRKRVYNHNWFASPFPTIEELEQNM